MKFFSQIPQRDQRGKIGQDSFRGIYANSIRGIDNCSNKNIYAPKKLAKLEIPL